jgi:hypothetical protein
LNYQSIKSSKNSQEKSFWLWNPNHKSHSALFESTIEVRRGDKNNKRDKKHVSPFFDQSTIFHARTRTVKTSGNNTNFFTSLWIHLIPLTKSKIISVKQSESP